MGANGTSFSGTLDAASVKRLHSALVEQLAVSTSRAHPLLATMPPEYGTAPAPAYGPTEADVRRIVREELDARFPPPSPLDVSAEDVRRRIGGPDAR